MRAEDVHRVLLQVAAALLREVASALHQRAVVAPATPADVGLERSTKGGGSGVLHAADTITAGVRTGQGETLRTYRWCSLPSTGQRDGHAPREDTEAGVVLFGP